MPSKTPIDARITAHFATVEASEATRLFATVRGVMAARKLLGKGTGSPKARTTTARAAKAMSVASTQPAVSTTGTMEA